MSSIAEPSSRAGGVRVFAAFTDLLGELEAREPFKTADSLSGGRFERARYGGEPVVLKYVTIDDDWIMRATGDIDCRLLRFFAEGLGARVPGSIDHVTLAVAPLPSRFGHQGAAVLLRDVGERLVPPGSTLIDVDMHERFIRHMAELHAAFWGWADHAELMPLAHHYTILTPLMSRLEAEGGGTDPVPPAVARGWETLRERAPQLHGLLEALAREPGPLLRPLQESPHTFVHADWKLGNLGEHADGRTILLDWDRCGEGPATFDLAWYLAVNCDRMPRSKEATIDLYRDALERHGVRTDGWWESQLSLTLLGAALMLAWSKVDDAAELGWWDERAHDAIPFLG
ncbi:MAG TPA: phosphotransferase [Candidatus Dormibacteraeota bacterium]|nr:phosphotransferase [Candidatus Dormibacteraeota bacterium]